MLAIASPATAASPLPGHFTGNAFGTHANAIAGQVATQLGRSAYLICPCRGTGGKVVSNNVDHVRAGDAFRADAITSTAQAAKTADHRAYVIMTNQLTGVDALDGLVHADVIKAVATTEVTASGFTTSSAGSTIIGLRVAGQAVNVQAGLKVNLTGFGYMVIKKVTTFGDGSVRRGLTVQMLRIVITQANSLDLPIGTVITVGHARSGYDRTQPVGLVSGTVFAADANSSASSVENRVGRAAAEYMGCFNSGQASKSNNVAAIDAPGVLASGTGRTNLYGSVDSSRALGRGTARVEDVDLLGGLVTADLVKAQVTTQRLAGGARSVSYAGSSFVNLKIGGVAVGGSVGQDTKVSVPGVGYVVLFETNTTTTPTRITGRVTMIHLYVTVANTLGLPVGTDVRIAFARTQVDTP